MQKLIEKFDKQPGCASWRGVVWDGGVALAPSPSPSRSRHPSAKSALQAAPRLRQQARGMPSASPTKFRLRSMCAFFFVNS